MIAPATDGQTDAGGLFLDGRARMTLRNPNPVGEIRYTLDNAIPTAGSTLYSGPVDLLRSTIVRAAVFVDGKPASMPSKGYFRILDRKAHPEAGLTYRVYLAVVFEGDLQIDAEGPYAFTLASDDGSRLVIDGRTVVDNDGSHGVIAANGAVDLKPGKHAIRLEWFNGGGGAWLGAWYEGPGLPRQIIDPNRLTRR